MSIRCVCFLVVNFQRAIPHTVGMMVCLLSFCFCQKSFWHMLLHSPQCTLFFYNLTYFSYYIAILPIMALDLRDDKQFFIDHPGAVPITTVQGEELRKLIGAPAYIECSSKTQQNVKAVFDAAIKVVLQPPKQKKKKGTAQKVCSILWNQKFEEIFSLHACLIIFVLGILFRSICLSGSKRSWIVVSSDLYLSSSWYLTPSSRDLLSCRGGNFILYCSVLFL